MDNVNIYALLALKLDVTPRTVKWCSVITFWLLVCFPSWSNSFLSHLFSQGFVAQNSSPHRWKDHLHPHTVSPYSSYLSIWNSVSWQEMSELQAILTLRECPHLLVSSRQCKTSSPTWFSMKGNTVTYNTLCFWDNQWPSVSSVSPFSNKNFSYSKNKHKTLSCQSCQSYSEYLIFPKIDFFNSERGWCCCLRAENVTESQLAAALNLYTKISKETFPTKPK
jgi:hypothetical protein